MNNQINYIGTIEDPEITELKKKYIKMNSTSYDYFRWGVGDGKPTKEYMLITYMDQKYIRQFRMEQWEKVDNKTCRIKQMTFIKDNMQEGESIYITWE